MKNALFCIADSNTQARLIIEDVTANGIPIDNVSVVFPDQSGNKELSYTKNNKAPEGVTAGAGAGGVVGGALGLLAGMGSLVIPGFGAFVAAGPVLAALSGAAVGATVGGLAGGFAGMGIPEYEAKLYEGRVLKGNILIAVHVDTADQQQRVLEIFKDLSARDISAAKETSIR